MIFAADPGKAADLRTGMRPSRPLSFAKISEGYAVNMLLRAMGLYGDPSTGSTPGVPAFREAHGQCPHTGAQS